MRYIEEPVLITEQKWPIDTVPLVSISCITYNHEKYIKDAIEGFLMQKTTFPVEINIHDDASTDNTANIIREYEEKYPHLINPIYQTENQYSKKNRAIGKIQRGRAKGKYYAICEGDDYWIDPLKLQKQISFLEKNREYVATTHNVKIVDEENNEIKGLKYPSNYDGKYEYLDYLKGKMAGQTCSIVMKNIFRLPEHDDSLYKNNKVKITGDRITLFYLLHHGSIYKFNEVMGSYRYLTHSGTSFSAQQLKRNVISNWVIISSYQEFVNYSHKHSDDKLLTKAIESLFVFEYVKGLILNRDMVTLKGFMKACKILKTSKLELLINTFRRLLVFPIEKLIKRNRVIGY